MIFVENQVDMSTLEIGDIFELDSNKYIYLYEKGILNHVFFINENKIVELAESCVMVIRGYAMEHVEYTFSEIEIGKSFMVENIIAVKISPSQAYRVVDRGLVDMYPNARVMPYKEVYIR